MNLNFSHNYLGATNWWSQGRLTGTGAATIKTVPPASAMPVNESFSGAAFFTGLTADAGSTTTTLRDAARTEADDFWNGKIIRFTSGANSGLLRQVTDFVAATDDFVLSSPVTAIGAGDTYDILPSSMANRIVVTGYHLAGLNTNAALTDIIFRHRINTANVVLDAFMHATTGTCQLTNSNVWIPLSADESLEVLVGGALTGVFAWTLWGKVFPASAVLAMKYDGDATNPS